MAFSIGDRPTRSAINVTPLIDVLLVLLIIFMVIQPSVLQGISATTPTSSRNPSTSSEAPSLLITVVNSASAPAYRIDQRNVDVTDLSDALRKEVQQHGRRVIFIVGSADLDYGPVTMAVNAAQAAGAQQIALLTEGRRRP